MWNRKKKKKKRNSYLPLRNTYLLRPSSDQVLKEILRKDFVVAQKTGACIPLLH